MPNTLSRHKLEISLLEPSWNRYVDKKTNLISLIRVYFLFSLIYEISLSLQYFSDINSPTQKYIYQCIDKTFLIDLVEKL